MFEMPSEEEFQNFLESESDFIAVVDEWLRNNSDNPIMLKSFLISILNFYNLNAASIQAVEAAQAPKAWAVKTDFLGNA